MDHIDLQRRFLHDVITPLCSKYQKDPMKGPLFFRPHIINTEPYMARSPM